LRHFFLQTVKQNSFNNAPKDSKAKIAELKSPLIASYFYMQKALISLFFVFVNFSAHAALRCEELWLDARLRSDQVENIPAHSLGPGFIVPNEQHLGIHKETFAKLSEGIYLTVGTERGLMSSALSGGKIKALIQVDLDPKVVIFNRINRALLAVSKSREHYLRLRLESSHSDWLMLLEKTKNLSNEDREILSRAEAWLWWKDQVQSLSDWQKFHQDPRSNLDQAYLNSNYLFDDVLFARIAELAKQNKIIIVHDSVGTETFRARVQQISEALGLKISAVDMSNAWQEGYLGHENTIRFLESLKPQMKPETQFVFTFLANSKSAADVSSIFKYLFTSLKQHANLNEISTMLANMARVEPSKTNNHRSRVNRYDDF